MKRNALKAAKTRGSASVDSAFFKGLRKRILKISQKYGIDKKEVYGFILADKIESLNESYIPLSILSTRGLSSSESIVKYMRENLGMKFNQIANLLKRNSGAISVTYSNSRKKHKTKLKEESEVGFFPIELIANRELSVLENISTYLKENRKMSVRKISEITGRNVQTIYTVLRRAKSKR